MTCLNPDIRNFPYPGAGQEMRAMPELTVRRLGESELELAWPLLRGRSGETSPGGWRR